MSGGLESWEGFQFLAYYFCSRGKQVGGCVRFLACFYCIPEVDDLGVVHV